MMEFDGYVALVCDFLERLPASFVIQRLSGEAPPDWLIAPAWCLDKPALLAAVDRELLRRDGWQGKCVTAVTPRPRRLALPLVGS